MEVYCLTNKINGKKYVGQTVGSGQRRWTNHKSTARHGKKTHFCDAIRHYGPGVFELSILAKPTTSEEMCELEIQFIKEFKTIDPQYGYTTHTGGTSGPMNSTFRQKARQRRIGTKQSLKTRQLIATSHTGRFKKDLVVPDPSSPRAKRGSGPTHGRASTYDAYKCRCALCCQAKRNQSRRHPHIRSKQ